MVSRRYERGDTAKTMDAFLERVTGGVRVIDTDHSAIHNGEAYIVNRNSENVADAGSLVFEIITPANLYVHMRLASVWPSAGLARFESIEAPTLTTGTTAVIPVALNRNDGASAVIIKSDPTGISGGTTLRNVMFGGGGPGTGSGGGLGFGAEFVLKPSTTYLARLTNLSGGLADMTLGLFWYEETLGGLE